MREFVPYVPKDTRFFDAACENGRGKRGFSGAASTSDAQAA